VTERPTDPAADLRVRTLRDELDDVDRRLVELLHRRARLVRAVAQRKRALGMPALDPARERAMAEDLLAAEEHGLPPRDLARVLAFAMRRYRALAQATANAAPQAADPDQGRPPAAT